MLFFYRRRRKDYDGNERTFVPCSLPREVHIVLESLEWVSVKEHRKRETRGTIYDMVLGQYTLGKKMKDISRDASLSEIHTNYWIRATALT